MGVLAADDFSLLALRATLLRLLVGLLGLAQFGSAVRLDLASAVDRPRPNLPGLLDEDFLDDVNAAVEDFRIVRGLMFDQRSRRKVRKPAVDHVLRYIVGERVADHANDGVFPVG
jgi:hypothetical protein